MLPLAFLLVTLTPASPPPVTVSAAVSLTEALEEAAKASSTPIVYVTHDRSEVAMFADEVVVLDEGRVVQHASRREWQDTAGAMPQGAS